VCEVAQPSHRLQPIQAGHLDVEEYDVRPVLLIDGDPLAARRSGAHVHALVVEDLLERLPDARFVVDDEHAVVDHGLRAPKSTAPAGRIRISRTPGGIVTGTRYRPGSSRRRP